MPMQPRLSPQTVAVLQELIAAPSRWRYGYELMQATTLAAGTLYPILSRLSDHGWLESARDTERANNRPPRHLYRLTATGRDGARDMILRAVDVYSHARAR